MALFFEGIKKPKVVAFGLLWWMVKRYLNSNFASAMYSTSQY